MKTYRQFIAEIGPSTSTQNAIAQKKIKGLNKKRWVYGTKKNKWILVGPEDRDFESGISQDDFKRIGKAAAKKKYLNQ